VIHLLGTTVIHLANVVLQLLHLVRLPTASLWKFATMSTGRALDSEEYEEEGTRSTKHSSRPSYTGKRHHTLLRHFYGPP
jgi:hypothetical protein